MTESPREHAAKMLTALRVWWRQYQDENVPKEFRPMVSSHVINEMARSQFGKKTAVLDPADYGRGG